MTNSKHRTIGVNIIFLEYKRLCNIYYSFKSRHQREFSKSEFIEWYIESAELGCYYCGIDKKTVTDLIEHNQIKSNRFFTHKYKNQSGEEKCGTRGRSFEVDRKNPNGPYSKDNCVLCCYFCNNDKSDIFSADQYIEFIGGDMVNKINNPRYRFLISLHNNICTN